MKYLICSLFAFIVLVSATLADSITVYITDSGECYHEYLCPYAPDATAKQIENVFMYYRPCSHCNPPVVEWDANGKSFVAIETFYAEGSMRISKKTPLQCDFLALQNELSETKATLQQSLDELNTLKRTLYACIACFLLVVAFAVFSFILRRRHRKWFAAY